MLHTLFRFFVLSALPGLYALQVYIYPFENRNDPELAGMALTIQKMLAKGLSERNVDVVAAQVDRFGLLAVLGETNRVYLPVVMREE